MNPIREAMDRLPGRWHKGKYSDNKGNFCGLGHVAVVAGYLTEEGRFTSPGSEGDRHGFWEIARVMNKVAEEQYPSVNGFAEFNDNLAESEEDVLRVMDKAAVLWDEQLD